MTLEQQIMSELKELQRMYRIHLMYGYKETFGQFLFGRNYK